MIVPVEKPVENLIIGSECLIMSDNGGSYSHLSPQCTDLSSTCIKSSQTPRPLDKTPKSPYNDSVRVQRNDKDL